MTGLLSEVTSIRHATVLLGRDLIRNWVTLLIMTEMHDKPAELIKLALTRARFCQLCALEDKLEDDAMYFTIGLLSLLDVLMGIELSEALDMVSLNPQMKEMLIERNGRGGAMLNALECLESKSGGDSLPADRQNTGVCYQQSIAWAEQVFSQV